METKVLSTNDEDIALAGKILANGGLVAFPTETVYGLGANALNEDAVKNIYKAKGRPSDNPLIVHIANKEDIIPLVKEVTPKAQALIDAFFPGPLTIILPKSDLIGKVVSGGLDTVAVRMPINEVANKVIKAAGCPIAAPSANTSGLPSPTRAKYVIDDMSGKIEAIIDGGDCEFGVESTVITLATDIPTVLRPGAVTKEMLEGVIGEVEVANAVLHGMKDNETAASPGMKYKHYAPKARVVIVDADRKTYEDFVNNQKGAFALCFDEDEVSVPRVNFGSENDDLSQARELFDALRRLDEMGAKTVYARIPHTTGVGMAVYNRLIRAAAFTVIDLTKPFTLGLTGQSGAGKSYICKKLKERGFNIIDCDEVVKNIYDTDEALVKSLCAQFGDIMTDGKVDRKKLGNIVFNDKSKLERLNELVHPAVIDRCVSLSTLLSGEFDSKNALLTFHAGAGGTEAQDWAEMLFRMYNRWGERHGYKVSTLDYLDGDVAGIKSATILVEGENAYGYLKGEMGIHRLVRVSPFDSSGRRHTSFASVEVMPEIDDDVDVEIRDEDIKMDVYRASGAGGQKVNKTSSAVRLTHIPTGIVVSCQIERSQHQNREVAMRMLKSKLVEIKERENLERIEDIKGDQKEIAWGSQIRSYVFMPYTMVKDHRTNFEMGNITAVMDGDLDGFINAYLKMKSVEGVE
jgi:peptide chain release factor 2/tRNA threonylcarbamoyl adenosine modification protein (Sua5/YciO/YrdC/YwlC family)